GRVGQGRPHRRGGPVRVTGEGERRRHGGRPGRGDRRSRGGRRGPARDLARTTAFDVLRAVDERDAYANLLLPHLIRERRLSARDAGLATELAYGTLRGMGTYDAIIAA